MATPTNTTVNNAMISTIAANAFDITAFSAGAAMSLYSLNSLIKFLKNSKKNELGSFFLRHPFLALTWTSTGAGTICLSSRFACYVLTSSLPEVSSRYGVNQTSEVSSRYGVNQTSESLQPVKYAVPLTLGAFGLYYAKKLYQND
jgi:hypothetical protein